MGNVQQSVFRKIIADNLQAYGHTATIRRVLTWQYTGKVDGNGVNIDNTFRSDCQFFFTDAKRVVVLRVP